MRSNRTLVKGIIPWIDPTPVDIKQYGSRLALALPRILPFLFDENAVFKHSKSGRIDVGLWEKGPETLVIATNLDDAAAFNFLGHHQRQSIIWVMKEGVVNTANGLLSFEPSGSAVFIRFRSEDSTLRGAENKNTGDVRLVEHNEL